MRYYNSRDTVILWNYEKFQKENDIRYLLILDDYNDLPEINDKNLEKLTQASKNIIYQAEDGTYDLSLEYLQFHAWNSFFEYLNDDLNTPQYNKDFAKYRKALEKIGAVKLTENSFIRLFSNDIPISEYLDLKDKEYDSIYYLYTDVRDKLSYNEMLLIGLYLVESVEMVDTKKKTSISKTLKTVERILKIGYIDKRKITLADYDAYVSEAEEFVKNSKPQKDA